MKVRKRKILPVITVLMISIMLYGCGKASEPSTKVTLNALNGISKDIKEYSTEETTQQDSTESNPEINTDSEMVQIKDIPESEPFLNEPKAEKDNVQASTEAPREELAETPTEAPTVAPEISPEPEDHSDFVAKLNVSKSVNQMIVVSASGSEASISMHEIQNGTWTEIMSTSGYVGQQGVGNASEEVSITPAGVYSLSIAFGVNSNPGTSLPYTKVDDSYYWVDDSGSPYYNRFVTTKNIVDNWNSAEHLIDYPKQYAYAIAIDYNKSCVPGAGSAIFLHCSNGNATGGCVAIPQDQMIFVLNHIHSGCVIVIDNENNISNY